MERITVQTFGKCPLLKEGFSISGRIRGFIYLSHLQKVAAIALLKCAECPFNKKGCTPYANTDDLREIMAKVD